VTSLGKDVSWATSGTGGPREGRNWKRKVKLIRGQLLRETAGLTWAAKGKVWGVTRKNRGGGQKWVR